MTEALQTNIFFFITSSVVVVVGIFIVIALYYLIVILKKAKDVSGRIEKGSQVIEEDLSELRHNVKDRGFKLIYLISFIGRLFRKYRSDK